MEAVFEWPDKLIDKVQLPKLLSDVRRGGSKSETSSQLETCSLLIIGCVCFFVRLFSVVKYESVIHEFDPYFNYRTTQHLTEHGLEDFSNWYDHQSWYPLGRSTGKTLYPGLMCTAASVHALLQALGIKVSIKDVCVFLAPIVSAFTSFAAYLLTKEVTGRGESGLLAALFLGLSPTALSRSVAGSYDNEAVAIFALVLAFYAYLKALSCRTALSALCAAVAYAYMALCWGGYVFVTNVLALHCICLAILGRLKPHHYVVYCVHYVIGTLLCVNIPFVHYQAVHSSEHMAAHGVFIMLNGYWLAQYVRRLVRHHPASARYAARGLFTAVIFGFLSVFILLSVTGRTAWARRTMTLLDPNYASKYIPIIASVSEHQAPNWVSYLFDIGPIMVMVPVGLWVCFTKGTDGHLFIGIYAIVSVYFSGVMVRLMLILAPASSITAAIGMSFALSTCFSKLRGGNDAIGELLDHAVIFARAVARRGPGGVVGVQHLTAELAERIVMPDAGDVPNKLGVYRRASILAGTSIFTAGTSFDSAGTVEENGDAGEGEDHENMNTGNVMKSTKVVAMGSKALQGAAHKSSSNKSSNNSSRRSSTGDAADTATTTTKTNNKSTTKSTATATTTTAGDSAAGDLEDSKSNRSTSAVLLLISIFFLFQICRNATAHGVYAAAMAYSHPSIVQIHTARDGSRVSVDDLREAFAWFRANTHPDARLMAWWDYGYQTAMMGNRTTIVDNNTWNNTHIATVGLVMASPEEEAYPILQSLDVDYVFSVMGSVSRYIGDDMNKFLWIIRIASGVYPHIREDSFMNELRQFNVGAQASKAMKESTLYKMCYYRFGEAASQGYDLLRKDQIPPVKLKYLEEVFTSKDWMIRVYKVKKPRNSVRMESRWATATVVGA